MTAGYETRRPRCRYCLNILLILVLEIVVCFHVLASIHSPAANPSPSLGVKPTAEVTGQHESADPDFRLGLDDVVLVIKTGATELLQKLPVHFETTLKRWPHVVLLSDFEEEVDGHQIHDALDIVSEDIRKDRPDFELWRRLKQSGRGALVASDIESGEQIQWVATAEGNRQAGWHLARFMNLPMTVKAQNYRADAKWYVFIDADTFISWSNTLRILQHLDHTKPHYLGSQVAMGPGQFFAHGGSGYALSQAALSAVVDRYLSERELWDRIADEGEFGEVPLALALMISSIPLTWTFPLFQGGKPLDMNFAGFKHGRNLWCYPAVTYHHTSREEIIDLAEFEDAWNSERRADRPFHHSDVFRRWALPLLHRSGEDLDNLSEELVEGVENSRECQASCHKSQSCLQWSFGVGECRIDSGYPRVGVSRPGYTSGWSLDRIEELVKALDRQCEDGIFV
ncbi:hypothetical protein HII31_05564 [Pseudocercospora fuligena]|uniref:N-acetylgalactosaminide beta-1,3-galactosyltransferase n=1 Tax=Pseudocercospora fuligena TaxID=685502 RepID=A0A8H6VNG4_9PEZI|nr:hypothetical protein HII31_05564 [Pseudocercospora fuligena]